MGLVKRGSATRYSGCRESPVIKRLSNFRVKADKDLRQQSDVDGHSWRSHWPRVAVGFQPTDHDAAPSAFPVA